MEEKEPIKIKLSTAVIGILILIIIGMGVCIGLLYKKNVEQNKKVEEPVATQKTEETVKENTVKIEENVVETNTTNNKSEEENKITKKEYTYSELKGVYKTKLEDISYELSLYENGTFNYAIYMEVAGGIIGKYSIVDDTIVLNCMYQTFSDYSFKKLNENRTLKINSDGSLKDTQKKSILLKEQIGKSEKDVVLKKTSDQLEPWSLEQTIKDAEKANAIY